MFGTPPGTSRSEPRLKLLHNLDSLNANKTASFECDLDSRKQNEIRPELSRDCRVRIALVHCFSSEIPGRANTCDLEHLSSNNIFSHVDDPFPESFRNIYVVSSIDDPSLM